MSPSLPLPAETRRRLNEHDRRWPLKFGLRAVATLFAFIAMVIFAATTSESKKNYGGNDWVDGMPLAPVCPRLLLLLYSFIVSSNPPRFLKRLWLCKAWQSITEQPDANRGASRSSLPYSTIPWSSFSRFTTAMAAPSTQVGMLASISSSGLSLSPLLSSQWATAGFGTGSPFYSSSMASFLAKRSITGVTNVIRSSTPWERWKSRRMCSWP